MTPHENQVINALIASRQPGFSMPSEFYNDPLVYRADVERIWQRGWLFVGHTCQIPNPGDYFTFEIGDDSLIVVRDDNGEINTFHNVCRHRGTLLCEHGNGHVRRFVCPYHQWVYTRGG
jgi:Rieske 2Fe-2S family protein